MDDYGIDGLLDIINPTDAFVEKEGRKERERGGKQHHDHYDGCFPTVL